MDMEVEKDYIEAIKLSEDQYKTKKNKVYGQEVEPPPLYRSNSKSRTDNISFKTALDNCLKYNAYITSLWNSIDDDIDVEHFVNVNGLVSGFLQNCNSIENNEEIFSYVFKSEFYQFYEILDEYEKFMRSNENSIQNILDSSHKRFKIMKFTSRIRYSLNILLYSHEFEGRERTLEQHKSNSLRSIGIKEGEDLWSKHFTYLDSSQVSWDRFINAYCEYLKTNITEEDETLLKHILDNDNTSVVTEKEFSRYLRCFGPLETAIESARALYNKVWFHNFLSVEEVGRLLSDQPVGTFLVRFSRSRYDVLVLEFVDSKGSIKSVPLYLDMPNGISIRESNDVIKTFKSIDLLIDHHSDVLKIPFQFEMSKKIWYHGNLTLKDSEEMLNNCPKGTFLVRMSEVGKFIIVVSYVGSNGKIIHINLLKTSNGYSISNFDEYKEELEWIKDSKVQSSFEYNGEKIIFQSVTSFVRINPHLKYNFDLERVPTINVKEFLESRRICSLNGIHNENGEGISLSDLNIAATSISTYPRETLGYDVICDQFYVRSMGNRVIFALADGCNWGNRPRLAAQVVCESIISEVADSDIQSSIRDTQDIKHLLLRSFSVAHDSILKVSTEKSIGTTTLVAGIVFQINDDDWGVIVVTVGDCKVFVYDHEEDKCIDITFGNRKNVNDPKDPGGRLGPYINGTDPDLRNLESKFWPLKKKDMVIATTDGIHDNLDPESFGLEPKDLYTDDLVDDPQIKEAIKDKTWEELEFSVAEKLKNIWMVNKLRSIIHSKGKITSSDIIKNIIDHCRETTRKSREFLENNPDKCEPTDAKEYPGKMDHTTGICIMTGCQYSSDDTQLLRTSQNRILRTRATLRNKLINSSESNELLTASSSPIISNTDRATISKYVSSPGGLVTSGHYKESKKGKKGKNTIESMFSKGYDHLKKIKLHPLGDIDDVNQFFQLRGPTLNETEINLGAIASGWGVSTLPKANSDPNDKKKIGDPNTTNFILEGYENRITFALSSSTRWGFSYAEASRKACTAFSNSLTSKQSSITNIKSLVQNIASSFDVAHETILKESKSEGTGYAGLLGGCLCKSNNGDYYISFINIGSNKAYLLSNGNITDLTDSKIGINRSSSGGKIGFTDEKCKPDTTDIELVVKQVKEGDIIMLLSPTTYHNFDPEILGKSPQDLGIQKEKWDELSLEDLANIKTYSRCENLQDLCESLSSNHPIDICRGIINHCQKITEKTRRYMEENLNGSEPRNFLLYPGKMGHTSCLIFKVKSYNKQSIKKIKSPTLLKTQFVHFPSD